MTSTDDFLGELARTTGITVIEAGKDRVIETAPVVGNRQPYGILHGGMNAVLVEDAGSRLAFYHAPEGKVPVGTNLAVNQLRSVTSGIVQAEAHVVHQGRSSILLEVRIVDDAGKLSALGQLTCVYVTPA
ncbi:MAG: PaaI family thioesterase [Actinomycetaceae bacterium]|nr:PaaI family thioesterase [Arcanobacterium sp.]MDD7504668.1 PaaI family thioesterase [Actinomycetaceae bacterium]MDY6143966.1 PaaI family thioesterase [Arcanobacterium sp.]